MLPRQGLELPRGQLSPSQDHQLSQAASFLRTSVFLTQLFSSCAICSPFLPVFV